nr:hypothetical protein CparaKRNrm2_p107 [Cryptomonas paramecium]
MCNYSDCIKFNYLINKFIYRINSKKINFFDKKNTSILIDIHSICIKNQLNTIKFFLEKNYLDYTQCLNIEKLLFFFAFFNYKKRLHISDIKDSLKKIDIHVYKKDSLGFTIENSIKSIKNQLNFSETIFFFLKTSKIFLRKIHKLNSSFLEKSYDKKKNAKRFFFINLFHVNMKTLILMTANIITVCSLIICFKFFG